MCCWVLATVDARATTYAAFKPNCARICQAIAVGDAVAPSVPHGNAPLLDREMPTQRTFQNLVNVYLREGGHCYSGGRRAAQFHTRGLSTRRTLATRSVVDVPLASVTVQPRFSATLTLSSSLKVTKPQHPLLVSPERGSAGSLTRTLLFCGTPQSWKICSKLCLSA